ncbi:MAG: methyltransferase domain-containing protein [Terriglobia bacterium]
MTQKMLNRANIGCGDTPTEGWWNFDNSLSIRLARPKLIMEVLNFVRLASDKSLRLAGIARAKGIRWANACKRIPLPNESLDGVYSCHVLEHLDLSEAELFLSEIHRVLRPGGIIRLVLPDLRRRAEKYMADGDADAFMESLNMREYSVRSLRATLRMLILGDKEHIWMYDSQSLVRLLQRARFVDAREMAPGETMIPEPAPLNLREREEESIYVEARR